MLAEEGGNLNHFLKPHINPQTFSHKMVESYILYYKATYCTIGKCAHLSSTVCFANEIGTLDPHSKHKEIDVEFTK